MSIYQWHPIDDLPPNWQEFRNNDLHNLADSWKERSIQLRESEKLREFNERLIRQWSIETGIIERIYSLERGITQILIERGIEASLIPHNSSNRPVDLVVSIIQDQKEVIDGLFDFVTQRRELSISYIKEMHQVFTRNQTSTQAVDPFGNLVEVLLLRGDWKKWPNNPKRSNGLIHEYCPPEQVASEMDRLIEIHREHEKAGIPAEIEAAWLHHRFTQIHPFQDGNGRVARALASLIFLREGWFPLVITNEIREQYIDALEDADLGDISALVNLCSKVEISSFRTALGISEDLTTGETPVSTIIEEGLARIRGKREERENRAFDLSKKLEKIAYQELHTIAQKLSAELVEIDKDYWATAIQSEPGITDFWFKSQIIQTAKLLRYYADTRSYRSWVQLKIREERLTNFLISFHALGVEFFGLMAASAFIEFREVNEINDTIPEGPYAICTDIFQFSFKDDEKNIIKNFRDWLNNVIVIGLEQWRKQL